jgi:hypothetical protein
MDPDMNKYDLNHRVAHHPKMSIAEWEDAYRAAVGGLLHARALCARSCAAPAAASSDGPGTTLSTILWFYLTVRYEGVHPLEGGALRLKFRRDRRHGMPIEKPYACSIRAMAARPL